MKRLKLNKSEHMTLLSLWVFMDLTTTAFGSGFLLLWLDGGTKAIDTTAVGRGTAAMRLCTTAVGQDTAAMRLCTTAVG